MQLQGEVTHFASGLVRDCDIDSMCAFISDKTTKSTKLFYLGNFGVSEEVLDRYRVSGFCDSDPFTDTTILEAASKAANDGFHVASHPRVARCGQRAAPYWQFVSHHDVDVVGASTMRLQPRLYLAIGAHRNRRRHYHSAVPVERLAHGIDVLQNKIASNLLAALLAGGKGYKTLLSIVDPDHAAPADRIADLSARETEVARLVCEGRQNKEIAWIASMSECTVENHLRRIYGKLGIHNRAALVARMNGVLA